MNRRPSPYVGPRPFTAADLLPARAAEVVAARQTLISARIVVLHSPSGAGKTSLLEAKNGLRQQLVDRQFVVHRSARVNLPPPPGLSGNRYLHSAVCSLLGGLAPPSGADSTDLATFLTAARGEGPRRRELLVFDQFEEILTADPTDDAGRGEFFAHLADVLMDPYLWALFVIREDYLGALAPWVRRLPTHLGFRLGLLDVEAARDAIRGPPAAVGVTFEGDALERLLGELRRIVVQRVDGSLTGAAGPWIEPVQLQVVCQRLWSGLASDDARVDLADVEALGDVDAALGDFYAAQVAAIAAATGVHERTIREFVGARLISMQGVRTQVIRGAADREGVPSSVVDALEAAHLIRGEERRGVQWFELAHDRLVAPVRADNSAWAMAHLHPMQLQAAMWRDHGEMREHLLAGEPLAMAESWAAGHPALLTPGERVYLQRSRDEESAHTRERAATDRLMAEQNIRLAEQARLVRALRLLSAALVATLIVAALLIWRAATTHASSG